MYFSIFSSSEYYSDEDIDNNFVLDTDVCLICWLPAQENNNIKLLSNFSHIITKCTCNPKIHSLCLDHWIKTSSSCPICRTKIKINIFKSNNKNILINSYIIFVEYTVYILKMICYASFFNLMCVMLYNAYFIYYFTKSNFDDNHYTI